VFVRLGSVDLVDKKMCAEHVSRSSPNSCGANLSALLPTMTRGMSRGRLIGDVLSSTTVLPSWASSSKKAGKDGGIGIGPGRAFRDWEASAAAAAAEADEAEAEAEVVARLEDAVRARGRKGEK
jgi:hypothetical protein